MSAAPPTRERARALGRVLAVFGVASALVALAFTRGFVAQFDPVRAATAEAAAEVVRARVAFAVLGALLAGSGAWLLARATEHSLVARRGVARAVLAVLLVAFPLAALELVLAPFAERPTSIFTRDAELGWRLEPLAVDVWGGQPVRINAHGLRGPDRAYEKPAGVRRVLFLGDSVTFGFGIADDTQTLPAQVERELAAEHVECINTAVDGWSTWQEHAFLVREGFRYQPDVVVVNFVLNDVNERFELAKFGGQGEGFQLERSLVARVPRALQSSSILWFARELRGRMRYGADTRAGAQRADLADTFQVLFEPDSDAVQSAWSATLLDVDALVRTCREKNVPVLLVLFPYATQLYRPELDSPAWILARFAQRRELPFLDVKPALLDAVKHGTPIESLFLDPCHPTPLGDEIAAREIARVLRERWFTTRR